MKNVFWFRRDLRLDDNRGLALALSSGAPVIPIFIFDDRILKGLPKRDARVEFIHSRLTDLNEQLAQHGSQLAVYRGDPVEVWTRLLAQHKILNIFCNEDYEPYAVQRDGKVAKLVKQAGGEFNAVKDQVVFAKDEVVKDNGEPYRVFTPYSRRWLSLLSEQDLKPTRAAFSALARLEPAAPLPTLSELGFEPSGLSFPGKTVKRGLMENYGKERDLMGSDGTTRLGLHLRFGTVSVRKVAAAVRPLSAVLLKELIWREFFMQILFHYPHTVDEPFDPRYKQMKWRNSEEEFARWREGRTGYPIVDAGMRELNQTGFMHNRARMVTASFLTKHLLVDWRKGERYFAARLLDFELASNVGNWQWVAGCGCDAAPYFRVFNPALQAKKFDPKGEYVKKWVPEAGSSQYPEPMVDHELARRRALKAFGDAVKGGA